MTKYYVKTEERIGLDYYAGTAQNIVDAREKAGMTQDQLAEKLGWKKSRLVAAENVRIRLKLDDMKDLAKALNVDMSWLINEEFDAGGRECIYLIWTRCCDMKIYVKGPSAQFAYLKFYQDLWNKRIKLFNNIRDYACVRLVGEPITETELRAKYNKRNGDEDDELPGKDDAQ